jgi:hypothetical protein
MIPTSVTGTRVDVRNLTVGPYSSQINLPATSQGNFVPFTDGSTPLRQQPWPKWKRPNHVSAESNNSLR